MGMKKNKKIFFFYNSGSFFISHRLEYSKFLLNKNYDVNLVSTIDNFEKENASEKKRKKIYMTQNEIQKLISQKKNNSQEEDLTDNPEADLEKQKD